MKTEDLKLIPDHQGERVRENLRRIEEWAKNRVVTEKANDATVMWRRFLLMGS